MTHLLIVSLDGSLPILRHEIEATVDGSAFRNAYNHAFF